MIWQKKRNKFTVAGNREFKEEDKKSAQLSLKPNPWWVPLYKMIFTENRSISINDISNCSEFCSSILSDSNFNNLVSSVFCEY